MENFNTFKDELLNIIQEIEEKNGEAIDKLEIMTDEYFNAWAETGEERLQLPDPVMVVVSLKLNEIFGKLEKAREIIKSEWYTGLFHQYYPDYLEFLKDEQAEGEIQPEEGEED